VSDRRKGVGVVIGVTDGAMVGLLTAVNVGLEIGIGDGVACVAYGATKE